MSEQLTTEDWRDIHKDRQERRAERRDGNSLAIMNLCLHGFDVRKLTEYCFRVDDKIDLYPTGQRYHVLQGNRRGRYDGNVLTFVQSRLRGNE